MEELSIDGRVYSVEVHRQHAQHMDIPRLVVVAYQPNELARRILRACVRAIQTYTPQPHVLWVIDNNSPLESVEWLLQWPGLCLALNRTEPLPPEGRRGLTQLAARLRGNLRQSHWGSYANAVGLELAVRLVNPTSRYLMTLHMDTMPCHSGWLSFLLSKLEGNTAAAGVRMDRSRTPEGVLHVLGCLVDFQVFGSLCLSFWPQLPQFDVGDRTTVELRKAGYGVFACENTLWEPSLVERIPEGSPLRHLQVDRAFDDRGNVVFLHLGRGIRKSRRLQQTGTPVERWLDFGERLLPA